MRLFSKIFLDGLFFVLFCTPCYTTVAFDTQDADAIVEVETEPAFQVEQVKLFYPTSEWKTIEADETVFVGLHYRINMATGLKEAKLMDGNNGTEYYRLLQKWLQERQSGKSDHNNGGFKIRKKIKVPKKSDTDNAYKKINSDAARYGGLKANSVALVPVEPTVNTDIKQNKENLGTSINVDGSFVEDLRKLDDLKFNKNSSQVEQDNPVNPHKFRSYEELKKDLADLELMIDDEQHVVSKLLSKHEEMETEKERVDSLLNLKYFLHNIDNAQVFIDEAGLRRVAIPSLETGSTEERIQACRLVSACVQNYPKGQISGLQAGLLVHLAALLQEEPVRSAAVSSIGSLVRGFPSAQKQMVQLVLPSLLHTIAVPLQQPAYADKVYALLGDLLLERLHENTKDKAAQLASAKLEERLEQLGWCSHLQGATTQLLRQHHSGGSAATQTSVNSLLHPLFGSTTLCASQLRTSLTDLHQLADIYLAMAGAADTNQDERYAETADTILQITENILRA